MSLSKINPDWTVVIPKAVRDNLELHPGDELVFSNDFELYDVSRVSNCLNRGMRVRKQSVASGIRRIAEASPSYDLLQVATFVSADASFVIPQEVVSELSLEVGELVVFVRDEVSYWMLPLISPSQILSGTCPSDNTGDAYDDVVMNYIVMITKETRREIGENMENICREGKDDPFCTVAPIDEDTLFKEIESLFAVLSK